MNAMLFNPIIALLHNQTAERWHPIVFVESPMPGGAGPVRHKSKMHHTTGFATREEAVANATNDLGPKIEGARLAIDEVFDWDGEGVPAMVHFFC